MNDRHQILLDIADTRLALEADRRMDRIQMGGAYEEFINDGPPDLKLRVLSSPMPALFLTAESLVFDVRDRWGFYRTDEQNILVQRHSTSSSLADRLMIIDREFAHGDIYIRGPFSPNSPVTLPNPLEYPLGQVLIVCLLARGRGVMVHACGIDDHGRGFLFAGNSGHGKSTIARLWHGEARVLNDDRIVVRERDGQFWMYATPWHGDYAAVSSEPVPLAAAFVLGRGSDHQVVPVSRLQASTRLLTRLFPPLWDPEGMAFTLDFLARLTAAVPCSDLAFVPDKSVVDFVRCSM